MQSRYPIFDLIKAVASFMVVCIHYRFPTELNTYLLPLTRWAVPFFFAISGYLLSTRKLDEEILKKSFNKVLITLFSAVFFYIIYIVLYNYCNQLPFDYNNIIKFPRRILLNLGFSFLGIHLWYLEAYLWVLLFLRIVIRLKIFNQLIYFIPILLCFCITYNYLTAFYSEILSAYYIPNTIVVTRNFLFTGLPFFLLGHFLQIYEQKLTLYRFSNGLLFNILFVCFLINVLEARFVGPTELELYISNIFQVILLMIFAIRLKSQSFFPIIERIGNRHSLNIYIYHIALMPIFYKGIDLIGWNILRYLNPFILFGATVCFSVFVNRLKRMNLLISIRS